MVVSAAASRYHAKICHTWPRPDEILGMIDQSRLTISSTPCPTAPPLFVVPKH